MQKTLRFLGFLIVATLLWLTPIWLTPMSAGTPRAKIQNKAKALKIHYLGTASWYGKQRQGKKMANGQKFDSRKFTAASWYFPFGTQMRVMNVINGQSVIVTITDRGPNLRLHRIVDLSEAAAEQLDYLGRGLTTVFVFPVAQFDTASAEFDFELAGPVTDTSADTAGAVEYQANRATSGT